MKLEDMDKDLAASDTASVSIKVGWIQIQGKQLFHFHFPPFSERVVLKEKICSSRSKFFPLRVVPFWMQDDL